MAGVEGSVEVQLSRVGFCSKAAWFANRSTFRKQVCFPAMVALIRHPTLGTILFDAGYGVALETSTSAEVRRYRRLMPSTLPEEERIGSRLRQWGVSRVDLVFLSHFHPDHIGGLREVPGAAPILCSARGLERLRSLRGLDRVRAAFFEELLPGDFASRMRPIEEVEGLDLAGDGSLYAVPLPGHAAGQYGLLCRVQAGSWVFLCADAAWLKCNIADAKQWPAWPVRLVVDDYGAFANTLEWLHGFSQRCPEVTIIPSHCEESIREYERRRRI